MEYDENSLPKKYFFTILKARILLVFFMLKILFTITFIICANLLAFLGLWHILDALFETGSMMKLICMALSFPVLGVIMYLKIWNILQELHDIASHGTEHTNHNNW